MLAAILSSSVIAALISLVGVCISTSAAKKAATEKLEREFRLHYQAEKVAQKLLEHPKWKLRSFDEIKRRLGGFEEDELRRLLVQAGAVRFERISDSAELWGLLGRNNDELDKEQESSPRSTKRQPPRSQLVEGA